MRSIQARKHKFQYDKERRADLKLALDACNTLIRANAEKDKTAGLRAIMEYHAPDLENLVKRIKVLAPELPQDIKDVAFRTVTLANDEETSDDSVAKDIP